MKAMLTQAVCYEIKSSNKDSRPIRLHDLIFLRYPTGKTSDHSGDDLVFVLALNPPVNKIDRIISSRKLASKPLKLRQCNNLIYAEVIILVQKAGLC